MKTKIPRLAAALVAAAALFGLVGDASAGFVYIKPIVTPRPIQDPIFLWEFEMAVDGGVDGVQLVKNQAFFTIYDIPGLISGSNSQPTTPPFAASFNLLGTDVSPVQPVVDDPALLNVTFRYTGNDTINVLAGQRRLLGIFSFLSDSDFSDVPRFIQLAEQSINRRTGQFESSLRIVRVNLPEPTSLALFLPGAALMGTIVWRRRRREGTEPVEPTA